MKHAYVINVMLLGVDLRSKSVFNNHEQISRRVSLLKLIQSAERCLISLDVVFMSGLRYSNV